MLNGIFIFIVLTSVFLAVITGQLAAVTDAILNDSRKAVDISLKLVGVMALFLGLMKVGEAAGLLRLIARAVAPVMRRLFPSVPPEHPAMSAMIMNIGANMLGLANAATPFGIKAIEELNKLNSRKGTATNAMALFLAINTAGLAIMPLGVVGLRAAAGSANAMGIAIPTWFASGCATVTGILAAFWLSRWKRFRATEPPAMQVDTSTLPEGQDELAALEAPEPVGWRRYAMWAYWAFYLVMLVRHVVLTVQFHLPKTGSGIVGLGDAVAVAIIDVFHALGPWLLPAVVFGMILFGWSRRMAVYGLLVEGAKEGFQVALRIIPFLVAILVAAGMFRASGGMDLLVRLFGPVTSFIGMPAEALPMAVLRPLTGSGALAIMVDAMNAYGPDSLIGYMVSTLQGSTETTFYVLAVYFGAVGVTRTRHTLPACLAADAAGILAAVFIVNLMFG